MLPGLEIFEYQFVVRALVAGLLAAAIASALGVYVVLRGAAMIGDGLAHIAFGGIALGLFANVFPFGVAVAFAVLAAVGIELLRARGLVLTDTAIAIFFTTGLAAGLVLVSLSGGFNVDLFSFLFGSLVAVGPSDLPLLAALALAVGAFVVVFEKELFYVTLDADGARVAGLPVRALEIGFAVATALAVVVTARVAGVLLVSALLVVPAAASLQVAASFRRAVLGSVAVALFVVVAGLYLAFAADLPLGASIALSSVSVFALSLVARRVSGARGVVAP
ncbi:MAG TPA: metal ABC transporter permease [Candidatus Thermoplasmatota archaeon]|nr:metal ABC transporter permease [Candidatus Thermoplasmatota archaeon]